MRHAQRRPRPGRPFVYCDRSRGFRPDLSKSAPSGAKIAAECSPVRAPHRLNRPDFSFSNCQFHFFNRSPISSLATSRRSAACPSKGVTPETSGRKPEADNCHRSAVIRPPNTPSRGATVSESLGFSTQGHTWRQTDESARMIVSDDQGKTWSCRGACNVPKDVRAFDEHMFVERNDKSIWLLARTNYGIGESVSTDRGKTWPELTPSKIVHPSARFFIRRLTSGNLLLVKHGPIDQKTSRSNLMAFIYDYHRTSDRHVLLASFREEDAASGKPVTGSVKLRQVVSDASGE
ncbi:sialidase family protein [Rhodopirellula bahusiensis]|uniref:sialidase family protein n=1 Tax=Rhodopirellula bahusiensis TaxID=2014065 RepID=UPI003264CE7E